MSEPVYKIRNSEGLYSTGGSLPSFSLVGKTWSCRRTLNAHLSMLRNEYSRWPYRGCEIVVFEETDVEPLPGGAQ